MRPNGACDDAPDDPAGFVSQFGRDFKLGKNPFHIVKPDGTSDLTPKQQQEAAAIFSNVFDGESYYNYKLQEAVKNIASRFGAKSAEPSSTKPQSAWEEIETTRDEQLEQRRREREDKAALAALDSELPMAMRRADEADEKNIPKRFYELLNPDYVRVLNPPRDDYQGFGGSQMWSSQKFVESLGCGITAMNDVLIYMTESTGKKSVKPIVLDYSVYSKKYETVKERLPVVPFGALGTDIAFCMNQHFENNDMPYTAEWLMTDRRDTIACVEEMLDNNIPAIISVGFDAPEKVEPDYQGDVDSVPFYTKNATGGFSKINNDINGHYMTVTAVYPETPSHGPMLEVSTWGEKRYIDYDEYEEYRDKHRLGDVFSNIVYIKPIQEDD